MIGSYPPRPIGSKPRINNGNHALNKETAHPSYAQDLYLSSGALLAKQRLVLGAYNRSIGWFNRPIAATNAQHAQIVSRQLAFNGSWPLEKQQYIEKPRPWTTALFNKMEEWVKSR